MSAMIPPSTYDVFRALNAGVGARIAHPTTGGAPWTLRRIMWGENSISLEIQREGSVRPDMVYLDRRQEVAG